MDIEEGWITVCGWVLLILFIMSLICLAPFVCSLLHLLGLCHFQCFNNEMMWVYVALSAIAGVLLLSVIINNFVKVIFTAMNNDGMADFIKKMILYHHKLENPNRAKELNEVKE